MSKPVRPSAARLAIAVVLPLAVFAAIYYSTGGQIGGASLRLEASLPSEVSIGANATTPVDLKLELTNRTGGIQKLAVADACKAVRWVVQAPGETTVQSRGDRCSSAPAEVQIASGETLEWTETLPLDSARYKSGVTYAVYVDFYGMLAKAEFEAVSAAD